MFTLGNKNRFQVIFRQDTIASSWENVDWKKGIGDIRKSLHRGQTEAANSAPYRTAQILDFPEQDPWQLIYDAKNVGGNIGAAMLTTFLGVSGVFHGKYLPKH